MRNCSRCPPYFSDPVGNPADAIAVPWATMSKWIFRVQTWSVDIAIYDSVGNPIHVATHSVQWNFKNNRFDISAGSPSSEAHLATGWQITEILSPAAGVNANLRFFDFILGTSSLSGTGCAFTNPASGTAVFFSVILGGVGNTDPSGTSAVTVNVDGVSSGFDDGGAGYTGHISMQPASYWEYRKAAGTNPMYNSATGVALLPQQDDELLKS